MLTRESIARSGMSRQVTSLIVAALVMVVPGCGEDGVPTYPARGKVTFPDGTPLEGGRVEFEPVASEHRVSARAVIQPDGAFELGTFQPGDGALEGEHRAIVMPPLPIGDREGMKSLPLMIDPRFQRFDTSGLKFTVTRDSDNEFNIQVTSPGQ